jgi:hypothetical protein
MSLLRLFFISLLIAFSAIANAQQLIESEKAISMQLEIIRNSKDDVIRDSASQRIRTIFLEILSDAEIFDYPFSALQMATTISSDKRVRLFNWNQPLSDGTYKYYCFVVVKENKKDTHKFFELKDSGIEADDQQNKFQTPEKWMGALYYAIFPLSNSAKNDTYILLGWDGKDELSTRKFIDALTIHGDKIRLGASIFETEGKAKKRVIFEYANDASMSLKYLPEKKLIVFDHLSPRNPIMKGFFSDYGPDGTYDAFFINKDKLIFQADIDVSKFTEDSNKPYRAPNPR